MAEQLLFLKTVERSLEFADYSPLVENLPKGIENSKPNPYNGLSSEQKEANLIRGNKPRSDSEGLFRLFRLEAISSHLRKMGYPENSIQNMNRCGNENGSDIIKSCGCGISLVKGRYKCNLRTCSRCSEYRKKRVKSKISPYIRRMNNPHAKNRFMFLTISPKNYDCLSDGLKDIRKGWQNFIRDPYIADRLRGGFYVIETKYSSLTGYNIHIHAVIYGRQLDNKVRGIYRDSKLVRVLNMKMKRSCNVDIRQIKSSSKLSNYLLKYVVVNKDDFENDYQTALYINTTRKMRLINSFGLFYRKKSKKNEMDPLSYYNFMLYEYRKPLCICSKCNEEVEFDFDIEIIRALRNN